MKSKKLIYVIHEHHASHLHWDLRLEHGGTLKSWAVPKKPSATGEKRLAVEVANHAIEYAKFHGTIPQGQYGAGKVLIWDKGWYESIDWKPGKKAIVNLHGRKLKGKYCIVKFSRSGSKNWLFFKMKD